MADVFVDENSLKGIANAIRSKNGSSATYTPAEMEQAILDLQIPDVSNLDATAADILAPKVAFTADGETEGTIQTKSASDVTVSGDTVSAPAGYYPNAVSKSVQAGSAATPATIIPANPTISVNNSTGLVTASVDETQAITPTVSEGYVSAGTPGNVRATGSATSQLPTQGAATITPTQSQQTAVAGGKFTTGDVVVDPIPGEYVVPTGTKQITLTANGTTTEDVAAYANAEITANVPNTYAAGDEGKVVSNGELVAQGSDTVTANDTYDTTLINSLTVNVSGGGGVDYSGLLDGTISGAISNSDITELRAHAISNCNSVTSVDFPNVTKLNGNSIYNCSRIANVNVPKVNQNGTYCLSALPSLTSITLPLVQGLSTFIFADDTALATVDLGANCNALGGQSFRKCSALQTLILRRTSTITTCASNTFLNSSIDSGGSGCTIYIPKVWYDHLGDGTNLDYESATNWSTYNGYGTITWAQIEGSYYETHYADGTTIPT